MHSEERGRTGDNRHALARLLVGRFGPGNQVCVVIVVVVVVVLVLVVRVVVVLFVIVVVEG